MGSGIIEIGLVLFTTMAPAGAVAFVLVALVALFKGLRGETDGKDDDIVFLRNLSHYLIIPLGISVIGLIASATQLGTPANALNAFRGVGRSPLSNEVTCSVIFLALAGVYWLTSFYDKLPVTLNRIWLGLTCMAALVMVWGISRAYSVATIPTWDTVFVPVNLWLVSLFGGPLLAIVTLGFAGVGCSRPYRIALHVLLGIGLVGEAVCCTLQYLSLPSFENGVVNASDLVPGYPWMIVAFVALGIVSVAGVMRTRTLPGTRGHILRAVFVIVGFIGIFYVRLAFYGLHMTIGM